MFLKEKIKIWFAQSLKSFRYHLIFWNISLFFYLFLTGDKSLFVNYHDLLPKDTLATNALFISLVISLVFTILDIFFFGAYDAAVANTQYDFFAVATIFWTRIFPSVYGLQ